MSAATVIREIVERIAPPDEPEGDNWPVEEVERLVGDLRLEGYFFDYEPKVVGLRSLDDLHAVMARAGRTAMSKRSPLSMMSRRDKVCLEVGGWQFQADSSN